MSLTAELVRSLFAYDPVSGVLVWKHRTGRGARNDRTGMPAGADHVDGYLAVQIGRKKYLVHRIAWLHFHGSTPPDFLDHRNGDRKANWIGNLRPATKRLNAENQRVRHHGLGVDYYRAAGKWRARITVKGICHSLGHFPTQSAAQEAYLAAKRQMHEGCTI